jgi:hypothetical protein
MSEVSSRTEEVGEVQRLVELIEEWKKKCQICQA